MKKPEDDQLFDEIFGDSDDAPPAPPAPPVAAKPKPQPKPAAAPKPVAQSQAAPQDPAALQEAMSREAAQIFSEIMVTKARAHDAAQPPAPPPPSPVEDDPLNALIRANAGKPDEAPKSTFAESVSPWTLFKGFSTLAMLTYIVGFHGKLLADSWAPLLVISVAVTGVVLIVDFVRLSPREPEGKGKKRKPSK